MLPYFITTFNMYRHLCVGDVIFGESDAVMIIKWSKTIQNRAKVATTSLPCLGQSPLCPIKVLQTMLVAFRRDPDFPLFQVCKPAGYVP